VAASAGIAASTSARHRTVGPPGRDGFPSRANRLSSAMRRVVVAHGVQVEVEGSPRRGRALVVSNHVSWLDPVVLLSLFPAIPIAKREIAGWPILGPMARRFGVIFVERGDTGSGLRTLFTASTVLYQGASILSFPEGTTSDGDGVQPFHAGLFAVARRDRVPVVPVSIAYDDRRMAWTGDAAFVPHYLRFAAAGGTVARVRFGPPMDASSFGSAGELARAARGRVESLLLERHGTAGTA
jgi:1-acyl-sn-glycerol-3-phosphate acyltransferase